MKAQLPISSRVFKRSDEYRPPAKSIRQRAAGLLAVVSLLLWLCSSHFPLFRRDLSSCAVAGDSWSTCLHASLEPACPSVRQETKRYSRPGMLKTALTSFPRSGNSMTRSLVERATGYQTSSVYRDHRLKPAFAGESDGLDNPWLVKVHWPTPRDNPETDKWQHFDQAVRLIRNPIDACWSLYNLDKTGSHNKRVPGLTRLAQKHRKDLAGYMRRYLDHMHYWDKTAKLQVFDVRYENLRQHTLSTLVELLTFLLPEEDLPSLEQITCAIESDPSAYKSRKTPIFDAWDRYDEPTRTWLLEQAKEPWCKFGYDVLLKQIKGIESPINCKEVE